AVVGKDLLPPDLLDPVMAGIDPPRNHGPFVLPNLIRQQQILARQALEPIDEEAATHSHKRGLQRSREVHIAVYESVLYLNFKELRDHRGRSESPIGLLCS